MVAMRFSVCLFLISAVAVAGQPRALMNRNLVKNQKALQMQHGANELKHKSLSQNVRQYKNNEAQETAGFEVLGISFDSGCMSQGCWEITLKYNLVQKAISVLYIPRTSGNDLEDNGGGYPQQVLDTFEPRNFPCGVMGAGSMNACCIKNVMDSYRTPSSFETHMSSTDFATCPTPMSSGAVVKGQSNSSEAKYNFLGGKFTDMPYSEVVVTSDPSNELHGTATLRLDEKEVRLLAGKLQGNAAIEYTINMFVGMVSFVPTFDENGGHAKFMQTYHSQTPISLMKKNTVQYVLNGGFSQTFLNYVGTVLHNVQITEGPEAGQNAQFIQVSFTMPERYQPGGSNGELIPFSSVRVGKGTSSSSVLVWH